MGSARPLARNAPKGRKGSAKGGAAPKKAAKGAKEAGSAEGAGTGDKKSVLHAGNLRVKGVNFYHDKDTVKRLAVLRSGRPTRNARGKIVREAVFKSKDAPTARIQPDRRWFGNTRVVGQGQLDAFRTELGTKKDDPYQVLLRQSKLPMSLLTDIKKEAKMHLLTSESFKYTFGKGAQRKRPKLLAANLEELSQTAATDEEAFLEAALERKRAKAAEGVLVDHANNGGDSALPAAAKGDDDDGENFDFGRAAKDPIFAKGQSKRIWNELYKVIDSSDVVVHVLDARDPLGTRCRAVEAFIAKEAPHKHLIFLLNKCDLIPPTVTTKWVKHLSADRPTLAFHASLKNPFGKGTLIQLLRQFSRLHKDKKQISVGFIGYPNTGKSSIINTLRQKAVCPVAPVPGQTKVWQYVTLMKRIYLIDCPGVVPTAVKDSETATVLKGVVRIENVKNPEDHIGAVLARVKPEHIGRTYDIWKWDDAIDFLTKFATKSGRLLKGGDADISMSARMVLHDWLRGRIPYFTPPPCDVASEASTASAASVAGPVAEEEAPGVPLEDREDADEDVDEDEEESEGKGESADEKEDEEEGKEVARQQSEDDDESEK